MPRKTKRHDNRTRAQGSTSSAGPASPGASASGPNVSAAPATSSAPLGQYAPALKAGFRATTSRVQEMHHAIAGKTFDALQMVPGVSVPARMVQGAHDAITDGVYAAVRHAGSAVLSVAGAAEALSAPGGKTSGKAQAVQSALNGVFGDSLAKAGNALAISLDFHADGAPLGVTPEVGKTLKPRVCVFIHGLACDEHSWFRRSTDGVDAGSYGDRLMAERPVTALYVRYNTGLAVADNAAHLASKLQELVEAAPQVREIALIGHSMGGLVARSACDLAVAENADWLHRVTVLTCLGTPHQGAPLERLGHLAAMALGLSNVTQPLARIANARSRGIKDLRHGLAGEAPAFTVPVRLLAASIADNDGSASSSLMSALLGDGLVMPSSASDRDLAGDVERVELHGIGHMGLLNDPRVYAQVRQWLDDTFRPDAPRG